MQISRSSLRRLAGLGVLAAAVVAALPVRGADKRIVLIAGKPSHPPGEHEFRAGWLLMQKALSGFPGFQVAGLRRGLAVEDGRRHACRRQCSPLDNADAVLIYADGGQGTPRSRATACKVLDALAAKGVGLGFAHYGVEVPAGRAGRVDAPLDWRLLRGSLLGEPDVEAAVRQAAAAIRSRAASVRSPLTTSGISACAGLTRPRGPEARDADPRRHAERRGPQRPVRQPQGPVPITSSPPAAGGNR